MKLLVLGGTVFVGRHIVEAATEAGHSVTLFNRGVTNPDLFPELVTLRGDRSQDLSSLDGQAWDAVIDTSGYHPKVVALAAKGLSDAADHYTFISTISVYQDTTETGLDEDSATAELPPGEDHDEVNSETYGPLKALCEQQVHANFQGDSLIVRPGLIVGPHDPTGRFTYWPRRMARGGEVLAPGDPNRPIQLIDVRDLAAWVVQSVEETRTGTFNATGPDHELTMEETLQACRQASDNEAELTWVAEEFLLETGVQPFTEMPLWLPQEQNGLLQVDVSRAVEAGLTFRPLLQTAEDTLAWDQQKGGPIGRGPAMGPARELALLQAWHAKNESAD